MLQSETPFSKRHEFKDLLLVAETAESLLSSTPVIPCRDADPVTTDSAKKRIRITGNNDSMPVVHPTVKMSAFTRTTQFGRTIVDVSAPTNFDHLDPECFPAIVQIGHMGAPYLVVHGTVCVSTYTEKDVLGKVTIQRHDTEKRNRSRFVEMFQVTSADGSVRGEACSSKRQAKVSFLHANGEHDAAEKPGTSGAMHFNSDHPAFQVALLKASASAIVERQLPTNIQTTDDVYMIASVFVFLYETVPEIRPQCVAKLTAIKALAQSLLHQARLEHKLSFRHQIKLSSAEDYIQTILDNLPNAGDGHTLLEQAMVWAEQEANKLSLEKYRIVKCGKKVEKTNRTIRRIPMMYAPLTLKVMRELPNPWYT